MSRRPKCFGWAVLSTLLLAAASLSLLEPAEAQDGPSPVKISEILATNQGGVTGILDADGDSPDFIELHNTSASSIDIGGWALVDSDDIWEFPNGTSLAPDARLVVWASGKDSVIGGEFHANFKLRESGESLALYDAESILADLVGDQFPRQAPNISWGLTAAGSHRYFTAPTPGTPNVGSTYSGVVATPQAEVGRGFYTAAVTEALSSSTPGADVRYTLDGSPPTASSPVAGPSLQISPDSTGIVTVRARAFRSGFVPSAETSWSYVFASSLYNGLPGQGIGSLPVVVLNTDDRKYPTDTAKSRLAMEMVETDPAKDGFSITAGVKEFGETSVQFEKSNFRLFFESDYGPSELEYPVFDGYGQGHIEPAVSFDKLELRGGSWDSWQAAAAGRFAPSDYYLTDRFIRDTRLDMGSLATHGRFVNVFVNGDYRGFYQLRERFDHTFYASYSADGEGAETIEAIKVNDGRYSNNGDQNVNGDGSVFDNLTKTWAHDRQWVNAQELVDFTLLMSINEDDFEREFRGVGSMNAASPNDYIFLYNDNDMRLRSLKSILGSNMGYSPGFFVPDLVPHFNSYRSDPEFMQLVYDRAALALCPGGALTTQAMLDRLEFWRTEIDLAMRGEAERWKNARSIDYFGQSPFIADKYGSWTTNINGLRSRISALTGDLRTAWENEGLLNGCDRRPTVVIEDQRSALGRPELWQVDAVDPDGDTMTFTATGLPPGLSINAGTGEVTGTPTSLGAFTVTIRVEDANSKWSSHDLQWVIDAAPDLSGALVINEIMYHPASESLSISIDPDLASYIEIANVTDSTLDVSGVQFSDGVDYRFPEGTVLSAGDFLVVAESKAAFRRTYGFVPDGDYDGGLSNAGERIALTDAFGRAIDSVEFDDAGSWPESPDGNGASLSLIDTSIDNAEAHAWRASSAPGGSPGAANVTFESGDVNGSDDINAADVGALLDHLAGREPERFFASVADYDADGSVTLLDALKLARSMR